MPNIYTSKNVENGLTFDDLITKLLAYNPDQWGYTEQDFNNIKTDFNVSENSLYNLPLGNYKLKNMPNSPFNSEFVNVKILMGTGNNKLAICSIGGSIDYGTNPSETNPNGSGWKDLSTEKRQIIDAAIIVVSDTAPVGPFNNGIPLWVDTSKAYITGEIFLKILSGNDTWTSYTVTDSMDMSIYDKNGLKKDPYKEVMNEVEKFIGDYAEIIMHINNELKLIHIDASDREYFDTYLLTSENVAKYFEKGGEFYTEMVEYIKSTITTTTGLDTSVVSANFNTLKESLKSHYDNHVTEKDVENWNNKAAADHIHNLDPNVTVDISDITFDDSTIPDAAIPDSVKERPVPITSLLVLRNVDTSLLESTYHNGNMLYLANGNAGYDFYKIVDNSYFNTDDYMKGVKKFSVEIDEVNFADAIKVPSNGYTLADYGITDALSRSDLAKLEKSYEDELKCEIIPSNLTAEAVGTSDLYVAVQDQMSPGSRHQLIYIFVSIDTNKDLDGDVFIFLYKNQAVKAMVSSLPHSATSSDWNAICYGKDKFVAIAGGTRNWLSNFNSDKFAYSTDGITWTQGTMPADRVWNSVCYGKDKFVALTTYLKTNAYGGANAFAYSSDGITWTQGNLPVSKEWNSVCYGKDKFVAIAGNAGYPDNAFAYSSDGITWTQGTLPVKCALSDICYGKDKFVAIDFNHGAGYSSDGITWSFNNLETISSSLVSVCYGNDKFVAITNRSNTFIYSIDGINWVSGLVNSPALYGPVICYGDNKFVISNGGQMGDIIYSSDGITWSSNYLITPPAFGPVALMSLPRISYCKDKFMLLDGSSSYYNYFNFVSQNINAIDLYQGRISDRNTDDIFTIKNKVNLELTNTILNKFYGDSYGNKFHIKIYWDPERGLVFASPNMVSKLITADFINKNELTESASEALIKRGRAIDEKLS